MIFWTLINVYIYLEVVVEKSQPTAIQQLKSVISKLHCNAMRSMQCILLEIDTNAANYCEKYMKLTSDIFTASASLFLQ